MTKADIRPNQIRKQAESALHESISDWAIDKLDTLIRERGLSLPEVAALSKVKHPNLRNYLRKKPRTTMPVAAFADICRGLEVSADELLGLSGDYVSVPMKELGRDKANRPALVDSGKTTKALHFQRSWLEWNGHKREHLFAFEVQRGAAIEPVRAGDVVLVNSAAVDVQPSSPFLVIMSRSIFVATFIPWADDSFKMYRSGKDGEEIEETYKGTDIGPEPGRPVRITGKIVWRGGKV